MVGAGRDEGAEPSRPLRPLRFRYDFTTPAVPVRATLWVTACGVHRTLLNGREVGDEVLAPGWTSFHHRHLVAEHDVTDLVGAGANALGVEVAEGWYRGRLGWGEGRTDVYGTDLGAFAELELEFADGARQVVATDERWRVAPSAVLRAGLYDGETLDQRLDVDWTRPDHDASAWDPVRVLDVDRAVLRVEDVPPVRRIEEVAAVEVRTSPSGATLVDFGQNLVGRVRLRLPAVADATITLRHAEVLEADELGTRPLRTAAATDVVHLSGAGGTWEPAFTFHGFRYVEVDGWPGALTVDDLVAVVVHTDLDEIGSFTCSDPLLARLHENVRWGAKGNFVSVPTDCPQRDERLGWTGDLGVFAPAAAFLFDVTPWLRSWLRDLAAEQADHDGVVAVIVPMVPDVVPVFPQAGWGDAAVTVPWTLYERTGDPSILADQYDSMRSWVDAIADRADDDGLWRTWQLGDWLDPTAPPDQAWKGRTDPDLVAAAYQVRTTGIVAEAARILGRDDADRLRARAAALRAAFVDAHVTPDGLLDCDSPTAYALALTFDLLDDDHVPAAGARLRALVAEDGHRIGTGFLGTPLICDALVAAGGSDDAYRLLTQTECPSWLYPVTMGATTVWERWDSMLPDGTINPGEMTSFNHYAFGAVADFLHRRVAGLAPAAPGYRQLAVEPLVGGGLTSAEARHVTPHGPAAVAWTRDGARFALTVEVPDGATARVRLPDGSDPIEVGAGTHRLTCTCRPPSEDPRT